MPSERARATDETPAGALVSDGAGGFLGTTVQGGANNLGTVYRFNPTGPTVTVLHAFAGGTGDGRSPSAALVADGGEASTGQRNRAERATLARSSALILAALSGSR